MPTFEQVHTALDQLTNTAFTGYSVFYGNQDVPKQSSPFVKQRVAFTRNSQYQLGDTVNGRQQGLILFQFHVLKNTGSSLLNTWRQIVVNSFRSKVVGGAVLQNASLSANGESDVWAIEQWQVPFYFDS